ncbi:MAG: hypothetical protein E6590_04855 [Clostridiales bacterium]|uniref:hypothetical protein n=1 Tax=Zhenhengia sp. TaxID=2944208 RepID=UPI00290B745D|nr:hypothetical protein [Clostridiales bacterium]
MEKDIKEELKLIKEELKVQRALLNTLDIQFKNSPYNQNPESIKRKKQAIMDRIEKLERLRNEKVGF